MKVLSRFRSIVIRSPNNTTEANGSTTEEKQLPQKEIDADSVAVSEKGTTTEEQVSDDVQKGVQAVEAVTLTWSKKTLIAVFIKYV